jgi:methyl-accepting chemotaxis protein
MKYLQVLLRGYTIRVRMFGAIVVVLALLAAVGAVGLVGMMQARHQTQLFLTNPFAESERMVTMAKAMGDLRRYEKDLIINYEKPELQAKYAQAWHEAYGAFVKSANVLLEGEEDTDNPHVRELLAAVNAYKAKFEQLLPQIASGAYDNASVVNRLMGPAKDHVHAAELRLAKLQDVLHQEALADAAEVTRAGDLAIWVFAASLALAVIVIVPLTLINSRSIVEPLEQARGLAQAIAGGDLTTELSSHGKDESAALLAALVEMQVSLRGIVGNIRQTTESISTASTQIASGNQDLSGRTEQTAGSLQQTASSMEQLTGTVRQTADSARTANQLASSAAQAAQRGGEVVSQVVHNMDEITSQSRKIAEIIGTIDGIAFQTNILALNAAVEAARAGEQGRGFAVVAGEVRNLAQRSATAAREIKSLIGASVEKVESGSRLVQDAGTTMSEIVASVQRVSDIIGEITAASTEQSGELAQVNTAVTQLDQMTQQNAALVEESAAAAESLREQAARLAELVAAFRTVDTLGQHQRAARLASTQAAVATQAVLQRVRDTAVPAARPAAQRLAPPASPTRSAAARPSDPPVAGTGQAPDGDWTSF